MYKRSCGAVVGVVRGRGVKESVCGLRQVEVQLRTPLECLRAREGGMFRKGEQRQGAILDGKG